MDLKTAHVGSLDYLSYGIEGNICLCSQKWSKEQATELEGILRGIIQSFYEVMHGEYTNRTQNRASEKAKVKRTRDRQGGR
jgi:hypothetical protein